jgi:hypothetical protein
MRISSRALISATALASALALAGAGVAPSYAADPSVTQKPSTTDVQLGHKVTIDVYVNNIPAVPQGASATATDKLDSGLTFWSLQLDPQFASAACHTPQKNHVGTISCTLAGPLDAIMTTDPGAHLGTLTLKASKKGQSTNTVSVTAGGATIDSPALAINVHTGKGKKTGQQPDQNKGQNNGQQNGQGKNDNNGQHNGQSTNGNNGNGPKGKALAKGHSK